MGKKSVINSLSKIIANLAIHEILLEYTNKPESKSHLNYEVIEYRDTAVSTAREFHWNEENILEIKSSALKIFNKKMPSKYPDVDFPHQKIEETISRIIQGIIPSSK